MLERLFKVLPKYNFVCIISYYRENLYMNLNSCFFLFIIILGNNKLLTELRILTFMALNRHFNKSWHLCLLDTVERGCVM